MRAGRFSWKGSPGAPHYLKALPCLFSSAENNLSHLPDAPVTFEDCPKQRLLGSSKKPIQDTLSNSSQILNSLSIHTETSQHVSVLEKPPRGTISNRLSIGQRAPTLASKLRGAEITDQPGFLRFPDCKTTNAVMKITVITALQCFQGHYRKNEVT